VPSSAFSTKAICVSENFDLFIARSASLAIHHNWNFPARSGPGNGQQVTRQLVSFVGNRLKLSVEVENFVKSEGELADEAATVRLAPILQIALGMMCYQSSGPRSR
jgi:hypothetical protein